VRVRQSNASMPLLPPPDSKALKEKLVAAEMERQEASKNTELSAEVAKLRSDVDVLRESLATALEEVRKVKEEGCQERNIEETGRAPVMSDLPARVQSLEEEVKRNVFDRSRLEGLLRHSRLKENEARRQLQALQASRRRVPADDEPLSPTTVQMTPRAQHSVFSINEGEAESETERPGQELEFVYEDAFEMSRMMPFDKALQLAQRRSVGSIDVLRQQVPDAQESSPAAARVHDGSSGVHPDTGVPVATASVADRELAFEEPLRALEFALARLRGEAAAGVAGDMTSVGHMPATPGSAGTGELADVNPFDAPLLELEQVLSQLGASLEHRATEQDTSPSEAREPSGALVEKAAPSSCTPVGKDGSHAKLSMTSNSEVDADVHPYLLPALQPIGLNLLSPYAALAHSMSPRRNIARSS